MQFQYGKFIIGAVTAFAGLTAVAAQTGYITSEAAPDDVVVMRKEIAGAKLDNIVRFIKVPTKASVKATSRPAAGQPLLVTTADTGVECRRANGSVEAVDPKMCERAPSATGLGQLSLNQQSSPGLRVIVVDPAPLRLIQSLTNVDAFCRSNTTLDGAAWRVSCDPADLTTSSGGGAFVKVARTLTAQATSSALSGGVVLSTSTGFGCETLENGEEAPVASCSGLPAPNGGSISVPGTASPQRRTVTISQGDVLAKAPRADVAGLCSSTIPVNGQTWQLRCDADSGREHYRRVVTRVTVNPSYTVNGDISRAPFNSSIGLPDYQDSLILSSRHDDDKCIDTDNNQEVAAGNCQYADYPAEAKDPLPVQATFVSQMRKVYLNPAAVRALVPGFANETELCSSSFSFNIRNGSNETWRVTCDAASIAQRVEWVATQATVAPVYLTRNDQAYSPTSTSRGIAPYDDTLFFSGRTGAICRDAQTKAALPVTACVYAAYPANASDGLTATARFSPDHHIAYVDFAKIAAAIPGVTNQAAFCASTFQLYIRSGNNESWKVSCTAADIATKYTWTPVQATITQAFIIRNDQGYAPTYTSVGLAPFTDNLYFSGQTNAECRNSAYGSAVASSNCVNVAYPANAATNLKVAATFSPEHRIAYVDFATVRAIIPEVNNQAAFCSSSLSFYIRSGGNEAWKISCDPTTIVSKAKWVPQQASITQAFIIRNDQGYAPTYTSVGLAPFNDSLYFSTVPGAVCREIGTDASLATSRCTNVTYPTNMSTTQRVTATFSPEHRIAYVDFATVRAVIPEVSNQAAFCASSLTFYIRSGGNEAWKISCDPESITTHSMWVPQQASITDAFIIRNDQGYAPTYTSVGLAPFNDRLYFSTMPGAICRDTTSKQTVATAKCNNVAYPTNMSTVQSVPVTLSPEHRIAYVDVTKLRTLLPEITNETAFCASSLTFYIRSGANEAWKVSCNAADIATHSTWVPQTATITDAYVTYNSTSYAPNYTSTGIAPYVDSLYFSSVPGAICRDTTTGDTVASSRCNNVARPTNMSTTQKVNATFSPEHRIAVVDFNAVKALIPEVNNQAAFCASSLSFTTRYGGYEAWKVSCDPSTITAHAVWVPQVATPSTTYTTYNSTTYAPNYTSTGVAPYVDSLYFSSVPGAICRDTTTGDTIAASRCAYVANPSNMSTSMKVNATLSPEHRIAVVDFNAVKTLIPEVNNQAAFCASSFSFTTRYSGYEAWKISCDPGTIAAHAVWVPQQAVLSTTYTTYNNSSYAPYDTSIGIAPYNDTMYFSTASNAICRDTASGDTVANSRCAYVANPSNMSTSQSVTATLSAEHRIAVVDFNKVRTIIPEVNNQAAFCASSFSFTTRNSGYESWKVSCDASAIAVHAVWVPQQAVVASNYVRNNSTSSAPYSTSIGVGQYNDTLYYSTMANAICRDTSTGETAANSRCAYVAKPANMSTTQRITARFSSDQRMVYVDPSVLRGAVPEVTNQAAFCASSFGYYTQQGGYSETWKVTCNPDDIRSHYTWVTKTATPVALYQRSSGTPTRTTDLGATFNEAMNYNTGGFICRDGDDGQEVGTAACQYYAKPANASITTVPASFNTATRTATIDRAIMRARYPDWTNEAAFCSATFSFYTYNGYESGWKTACTPAQ